MCALVQPSSYRRVLLTVAQRLSKDDVDQIVFLLEDGSVPQSEVEQISSGVGLMRSLEQHGKVAPGRYFYLLSCLRDIGRYDLASLVTQSEPAASYLPLCFQMPTQLLHLKFQTLQRKQECYLQSKTKLTAASNSKFWQNLWVAESEMYLEITKTTQLQYYDDVSFSEIIRAFLRTIPKRISVVSNSYSSKCLKTFTKEFQICTQTCQAALSTVRRNAIENMSSQGTLEKHERYHTYLAITTDAHRSLSEFLADLVGEETVRTWSKSVTEDISKASDAILNDPFSWDMLSHILRFLQHISTPEIQAKMCIEEGCKLFLKENLDAYKDAIKSNSNWILAVLDGTSVVEKLKLDGLLNDTSSALSGENCRLVAHMAYASLVLLLLSYWESITQADLEVMKKRFSELLPTKVQEFSSNYCGFEYRLATFFCESLDKLRDETLISALGNSEGTKQFILDIFYN